MSASVAIRRTSWSAAATAIWKDSFGGSGCGFSSARLRESGSRWISFQGERISSPTGMSEVFGSFPVCDDGQEAQDHGGRS